ncbi:hypothetical protein Patl1_33323 [Pistacia atlantica]|uniref:Uncharacterized protein n=1 Tax=Pistacia atlantica TaxID=434234 RepID=A0ACC0ZRZ5_9ROSI|nr:hypothetical protein Patl1_33323 [Pistacia atlantica]
MVCNSGEIGACSHVKWRISAELPMAYMGKFLIFMEVIVGINPHMHWVAIQAIKVFSKNISLEFQIDSAFSTKSSNLQLCLQFVAFVNAFLQDNLQYASIMVKHLRGESNGEQNRGGCLTHRARGVNFLPSK